VLLPFTSAFCELEAIAAFGELLIQGQMALHDTRRTIIMLLLEE
jgi:hypothetical protein